MRASRSSIHVQRTRIFRDHEMREREVFWYLLSCYRDERCNCNNSVISNFRARQMCVCMYADFLNPFYLPPRTNADGREEYIRAGLSKSGRGVARIEHGTRCWCRGQHYGSAGTLPTENCAQAGKPKFSSLDAVDLSSAHQSIDRSLCKMFCFSEIVERILHF
jgi:hypothetical protein